jgi:hypothetical protein
MFSDDNLRQIISMTNHADTTPLNSNPSLAGKSETPSHQSTIDIPQLEAALREFEKHANPIAERVTSAQLAVREAERAYRKSVEIIADEICTTWAYATTRRIKKEWPDFCAIDAGALPGWFAWLTTKTKKTAQLNRLRTRFANFVELSDSPENECLAQLKAAESALQTATLLQTQYDAIYSDAEGYLRSHFARYGDSATFTSRRSLRSRRPASESSGSQSSSDAGTCDTWLIWYILNPPPQTRHTLSTVVDQAAQATREREYHQAGLHANSVFHFDPPSSNHGGGLWSSWGGDSSDASSQSRSDADSSSSSGGDGGGGGE